MFYLASFDSHRHIILQWFSSFFSSTVLFIFMVGFSTNICGTELISLGSVLFLLEQKFLEKLGLPFLFVQHPTHISHSNVHELCPWALPLLGPSWCTRAASTPATPHLRFLGTEARHDSQTLQQRSSNIFSEDLIDQPEKGGQFCSVTSHQLPQTDASVYWACLYISVSQAFINTLLINIFKQLY